MAIKLPLHFQSDIQFLEKVGLEIIKRVSQSSVKEGQARKGVVLQPLNLNGFQAANVSVAVEKESEKDKELSNDEKQSNESNSSLSTGTQSEPVLSIGEGEAIGEDAGTQSGLDHDAVRELDRSEILGNRSEGNPQSADSQLLESSVEPLSEPAFDFTSLSVESVKEENKEKLQVEEAVEPKPAEEIEGTTEDSNGLGFDFSSLDAGKQPDEQVTENTFDTESTTKATPANKTPNTSGNGAKALFNRNIQAIRLIKQIDNAYQGNFDKFIPSQSEREMLSAYAGWGRLENAFEGMNGEVKSGWEKEADELKNLLSAEEYESARASTLNAHYTPNNIVDFIWSGVKSMGYKGGKALEPSVGTGRFIERSEYRNSTQFTGVELDPLTASIAKALHGKGNNKIIQGGFQDFNAKDNSYDLVIGNPPFGSTSLFDPNKKHLSKLSIHNYFFAKSLELLKPNGILAMVVSSYLMDSKSTRAREIIGKSANLIGAYRIPETAFKGSVDNNVTTDVIFLQKAEPGAKTNINDWLEMSEVNGIPVNQYYAENPQNILGELAMTTGSFRESMGVIDTGGLEEKLTLAYKQLPVVQWPIEEANTEANQESNVFKDSLDTAKQSTQALGFNLSVTQEELDLASEESSSYRLGEYFAVNDKVFIKEKEFDEEGEEITSVNLITTKHNSKMEEIPLKEKEYQRLIGMARISKTVNDLRLSQIDPDKSEEHIEGLRLTLNAQYNEFVKKNGYLNGQTNKSLFKDDINASLLLSLEKDYDPGISSAQAKKLGVSSRKASCEKSAIFTKRTQYPYVAPTSAETPKDGLLLSLMEKGKVDLDYIAALTSLEVDAVKDTLSEDGLIFMDKGQYVSRSEYLSGNVKKKLKETTIQENVDALKTVIPADLDSMDISVGLGATWVPEVHYEEFIAKITGADKQDIKLRFIKATGSWELDAGNLGSTNALKNKGVYGTNRKQPDELLEALMNNKTIVVRDTSGNESVINMDETNLALEKADLIQQEWRDFVWADKDRREELCQIYNDTFNVFAKREFDGSHLNFPGKVSDEIFEPRPSQRNGVWRVLQGGSTLFDHTVGAGKTATAVMSVMELKRIGKAKKSLIAVPNHLTSQWGAEFLELYPSANVLVVSEKDFEKKRRKLIFNKMMTGDWDAIIIGHSQLMKIQNDPKVEEQIIDNERYLLMESLEQSQNRYTIKRLENRLAALDGRLKELNDADRDEGLTFDEIGIDAFIVDEAHEFKNLTYQTSMSSVGGLGNPQGSKKAFDLFIKTQTMQGKTNGDNLVFLTGTPISNTIAEMYTMQRYLDNDSLVERGIENFDAWVNSFAEVVSDWELTATGAYKLKSRLAKFVNLPELISLYQQFADVITKEDIDAQLAKEGKVFPVPKVIGGKPENVVAPRSPEQAEYIGEEIAENKFTPDSLIDRAESGKDIMLKIISDARKCALDMRIIDPDLEDFEHSKVNMSIDRILEHYEQWHDDKGTQLVFCDLSTPKGMKAKERDHVLNLIAEARAGDDKAQDELSRYTQDDISALMSAFSVYDDMRKKLVEKGIPSHEIAFIHDYNTLLKKQSLFEKVNSGDIRILMGSTLKMGAGMNVQERLVALHHLDAPWRPSDLEQREGRIIRQGNALYHKHGGDKFGVAIYRYATKETLDSMMWQIIENKANFIEQLRKGTLVEREMEDLGSNQATSAAEMKAASSGNPLILEEMKLRQDIKKLESLRKGYLRNLYSAEAQVETYESTINGSHKRLPLVQADLEHLKTLNPALKGIDSDLLDGEELDDYLEKKKHFSAMVGEVEFKQENRKEFGQAIFERLAEMRDEQELTIGSFQGFDITLYKGTPSSGFLSDVGEVILSKGESYSFNVGDRLTNYGMVTKLLDMTNYRIEESILRYQRRVERAVEELPIYKERMETKFEKEDELETLKENHQKVLSILRSGKKVAPQENTQASQDEATLNM